MAIVLSKKYNKLVFAIISNSSISNGEEKIHHNHGKTDKIKINSINHSTPKSVKNIVRASKEDGDSNIRLYIEETDIKWRWNHPKKDKCHYSNKRDYQKQPVIFGFNSWYREDSNCEIPCLNEGGGRGYSDGSIFYRGTGKCTKSVYFTMENVPANKNSYDIVSGIYLDTDVPLPMFGWNQYTYAEEPKPKDSKSQGLVAAFISNCVPQKRLEWLRRLDKAGAKVDSYGRCETNKEIPSRNGIPNDYNGQKLRIGETYKFIMAFENSNADDYVTEKLFGVLAVGSVPLYDGAPNGLKFAPNNHSVIFAQDFESPEKLAEYLLYLDKHDDEYQKYLEWKKTGPTKDWTAMVDIARIGAECRVCYRIADLHRKDVGMVFGDQEKRDKYIKVPSDWNPSKGIVVYIRHRGTFWYYSVPIPFGTTAKEFQTIIEKTIPCPHCRDGKGEFYEAYEYWTKQPILSDKITSPLNITLTQEIEIEVVFTDMSFYFENTPKPK
ncbi:glycosyltransferase [Heterostelium album PN500]|uniref:Fucosyltransferase n=1 Tax=Heterostelium pallidum (strain ATCC 26659 / Pp 5 / PN500) TaxID=670386 RepID=D3B1I3_HETP5|nr:glycosyltransferase [Heterostelium album PN500]EFA85157.1 glycosyltransferase [Heterostelium album PN500]|eukprot:XP_020437266.1 glycosyltransferase [Heterostelium album PN500]